MAQNAPSDKQGVDLASILIVKRYSTSNAVNTVIGCKDFVERVPSGIRSHYALASCTYAYPRQYAGNLTRRNRTTNPSNSPITPCHFSIRSVSCLASTAPTPQELRAGASPKPRLPLPVLWPDEPSTSSAFAFDTYSHSPFSSFHFGPQNRKKALFMLVDPSKALPPSHVHPPRRSATSALARCATGKRPVSSAGTSTVVEYVGN
ncbi:uncharacterized protein SPSK_00904 [Sporothrix schenckii 1099-18]|uniref:Uncharacterized protein n=1 Tax=Sporothrix schenckii 1099-18 TaxID=1397361 RepID=A0A0F2LW60_SPOSC|nr:uncharacterized protein SPSK_00904 [Sporothrix schenckii 1099-18]KJR81693.1 hypothetical protein SPSK_00904 [Sporothrix schenckii 1099-18]